MRIAYFDCVAGASGDMLLGALIDAGASLAVLRENIATLQLSGCDLHVEQVMRGALAARRVTVVTPQPETERHVKDLVAVIDQAGLPEVVKERSRATLLRIAQAEAHIHQHPVEEIHLHELGGDDTLIDIVGVVSALESLEITKVFVSPLPLSLGFVHCMHGLIPLPAPATLALLEGAPVRYVDNANAELVTPTGAALLTALADGFGGFPPMQLKKVGVGAGYHQLDFPNILRVWIGETQ